jgi:tripartite-type tricarboxylate transporter receptor subunit TctC
VLFIGTAPNVLCAHPARPFHTLADVIAAAKAKPKTLSYASIGNGSLGHLTILLLSRKAGIEMIHAPYRGGGPAVADTIAGHVDMIVGSAALVSPQVRAGGLRPIVQTGAKRLPNLANVATVVESGFAGFESYAWWGVFAPAGTPKPIIERFSAELAATIREERVTKQLTEQQQITLTLGGPEELRKFFAEQMRIWGAVVRENNIKSEI